MKSGSSDLAYSGRRASVATSRSSGCWRCRSSTTRSTGESVVDKISPQLEARMAPWSRAAGVSLRRAARHTVDQAAQLHGRLHRASSSAFRRSRCTSSGAGLRRHAHPGGPAEVYTALQSRIARARGHADSLYSRKYHEVAKNLARTDHIFFFALHRHERTAPRQAVAGQAGSDPRRRPGSHAYNSSRQARGPGGFHPPAPGGVRSPPPTGRPSAPQSAPCGKVRGRPGERGLEIYNAVRP